MKLRIGSFWYDDRIYRTATFDPGMRINEVDKEVTVAFTSDKRRPTHSGTGEASGREDDIVWPSARAS